MFPVEAYFESELASSYSVCGPASLGLEGGPDYGNILVMVISGTGLNM